MNTKSLKVRRRGAMLQSPSFTFKLNLSNVKEVKIVKSITGEEGKRE